jgi:hypothetical protein
MEGKDGIGESMLSHAGKSDGSVLGYRAAGSTLRVEAAFELVNRDKFYTRTQHNKREKSSTYTSSARKERGVMNLHVRTASASINFTVWAVLDAMSKSMMTLSTSHSSPLIRWMRAHSSLALPVTD